MCRVLSYLGDPLVVEDLLYKPDNSFIKQTYHPIYMPNLLNLAGFGMVAWDKDSFNPQLPFIYKTDGLPIYDENLKNLTKKLAPSCLLTHVRGVPYSDKKAISKQNVHPFLFSMTDIAFAHNGALFEFEKMKFELLRYIDTDIQTQIQGTTDSEWLYAVFLTQTKRTDNVIEAIYNMLSIIKKVRYKLNIRVNSPTNIFISNGRFIAATRFVFDYGWLPKVSGNPTSTSHFHYHSLWYTFGEKYELLGNEYVMKSGPNKKSIIIASEPLTEDTTTWIEVPEYSIILANREEQEIKINSYDLQLT